MIDEGIPDRLDIVTDDPLYLNKNTPVYMISKKESFVSQYYMNLTIPSWEKFGYNVTLEESLTEEQAKDLLPYRWFKAKTVWYSKIRRDFYLSEKISFLNHWVLWNKVVNSNTPSLIIEHDCKLQRDIKKSVEQYRVRPFSSAYILETRRDRRMMRRSNPYYRLKPSVGYYITPYGAQQLIRHLDTHTSIEKDLNVFLLDFCKVNRYIEKYQVFLNHVNENELLSYIFAHEEFDISIGKSVKDGGNDYTPS